MRVLHRLLPFVFPTLGITCIAIAGLVTSTGCSSDPAESPPSTNGGDAGSVDTDVPNDVVPPNDAPSDAPNDAGDGGSPIDAGDPFAGCTKDPGPPPVIIADAGGDDPIGDPATFGLDRALAGFPAGTTGKLRAAIATELGTIVCDLDEKAAPITVANFVGLARGTRPFLDSKLGAWVTRRFYDGLKWHRVIPDFVIQGGDPLGKGTGGPGYDLPVENHVAEPKGTLAMAASSVPSGSQFYVVVGKGPAPEYNVFGICTTDVATAISLVDRGKNDAPKVPVTMQRIDFARCP
jgi:peptidyl-prolyl cis-trans isomerase A (cyclophilin A)